MHAGRRERRRLSVAEAVGDREAGGNRECDAAAAAKRDEAAAKRRRSREGEGGRGMDCLLETEREGEGDEVVVIRKREKRIEN